MHKFEGYIEFACFENLEITNHYFFQIVKRSHMHYHRFPLEYSDFISVWILILLSNWVEVVDIFSV